MLLNILILVVVVVGYLISKLPNDCTGDCKNDI